MKNIYKVLLFTVILFGIPFISNAQTSQDDLIKELKAEIKELKAQIKALKSGNESETKDSKKDKDSKKIKKSEFDKITSSYYKDKKAMEKNPGGGSTINLESQLHYLFVEYFKKSLKIKGITQKELISLRDMLDQQYKDEKAKVANNRSLKSLLSIIETDYADLSRKINENINI